jgi:multimeric flavodoxin WrbA
MKAVALVVSAREHGNCLDFANYTLNRLRAAGAETELVNFYSCTITPCQKCSYECLQKFDPQKGVNNPCPIKDDVQSIWEKAFQSDILLIFVPTYGGLPPALWVAFSQRIQGITTKPAPETQKEKVVSAVILASPHWSGIAERTPSILADEIRFMGRKVGGFEIINNAGFETENLFGKLIHEEEIRRRLEFLADRTLKAAAIDRKSSE